MKQQLVEPYKAKLEQDANDKFSKERIRGDFYKGNVISQGTRYYSIDFDGAEWFCTWYELIKCAIECINYEISEHAVRRLANMLYGYHRVRKIDESKLIDALALYLRVQSYCTYYYKESYSFLYIEQKLDQLRWLLFKSSDVLAVLRASLTRLYERNRHETNS